MFAFVWRLALTTGTGSIFGFLVARQGYDAAIMAPMFIIMSFAYGLAFYLLVLMFTFNADDRPLGDAVLRRLKNLLGVFVAAIFYFTVVYHLTNLYGTENHAYEAFILRDGGVYTWIFWIGWVLLGMIWCRWAFCSTRRSACSAVRSPSHRCLLYWAGWRRST